MSQRSHEKSHGKIGWKQLVEGLVLRVERGDCWYLQSLCKERHRKTTSTEMYSYDPWYSAKHYISAFPSLNPQESRQKLVETTLKLQEANVGVTLAAKKWRVKTALVHWNAVTSWTLVAIPTSNCTSQATNWNWLANRGTEVLGVLLSRRLWGFSQPRSVEKQWACAQRRIKRALNKKKHFKQRHFAKSYAEPQLGPPGTPGPPVLHAWLHDTGLAKQSLEEALEAYQDTWICYQQVQAKKWKQMKILSASQKWQLSCVELRWVLRPVVTIRSIMIIRDFKALFGDDQVAGVQLRSDMWTGYVCWGIY